MKPVLFDKSATEFDTNGLGRLDCISCRVTEERNSVYELEAVVTESGLHTSGLLMDSIIAAPPGPGKKVQPFRVYDIKKTIGGKYTVSAQHLSYQLSYIPAMPFSVTASATACAQTLAGLKSRAVTACPFTFSTDVTTAAAYTQTAPASIRSRLGGVEGSVLDQFGGEYEWDCYSVILHRNRGKVVPDVTLRYGKNITDLTQEENISSTVTGVVPFWQSSEGTETVYLTERVVESQYADRYPFRRTITRDFSSDFEEKPTEAQLRNAARAYVNQTGLGLPKVNIEVSFVQLWQTEEYRDVAPLQSVNLCDSVTVIFERLGISTTAKIVKTVYDVLAERYESVEIGDTRPSLAQVITDTNNAIAAAFSQVKNEAKDIINNATAWLTGSNGYVVAVKNDDGTWKELLFLDTADTATAKRVLRINENGLGFSSTGINGPYTQAWTLDGKLVIGGTNVPSLTVYDSGGKILFQIDSVGMLWNSTYSSMTKAGKLTATDADITGKITAGSGYIGNGTKGFAIGNTSIRNGKSSLTDANDGVYLGTDGIALGKNSAFRVTSQGALTATNATLSGSLTTESGGIRTEISGGTMKIYYNGTLIGTLGRAVFNSQSAVAMKTNTNGLALAIGETPYYVLNSSGMDYTGHGFRHYFREDLYTTGVYKTSNGYGFYAYNSDGTATGNKFRCEGNFTCGDTIFGYGVDIDQTSGGAGGDIYAEDDIEAGDDLKYKGDLVHTSDRRLKHDLGILPEETAHSFIMALSPRRYTLLWDLKKRIHHGFYAQEVSEVQEDGWEVSRIDESSGYYRLNEMEIIADLVSVVQQQERRIRALEEKS